MRRERSVEAGPKLSALSGLAVRLLVVGLAVWLSHLYAHSSAHARECTDQRRKQARSGARRALHASINQHASAPDDLAA